MPAKKKTKTQSKKIAPHRQSLEKIEVQIGESIRRWRVERGYSIRETAENTARQGVACDGSYLSRMERGKVSIPMRTLFALCKVLEVPPAQIIGPHTSESRTLQDVITKPIEDKILYLSEHNSKLVEAAIRRAILLVEDVLDSETGP